MVKVNQSKGMVCRGCEIEGRLRKEGRDRREARKGREGKGWGNAWWGGGGALLFSLLSPSALAVLGHVELA